MNKELANRYKSLYSKLDENWKTIFIVDKINLYYLTNTMQDGLLVIERDKEPVLWVRQNYEKAKVESSLENIQKMRSYSQISVEKSETVYVETSKITIDVLNRLKKSFQFENVKSIDPIMAEVRSVKSNYELKMMKQSGKIHSNFLKHIVPNLLVEGLKENELLPMLYHELVKEGHHGVARFGMFNQEILFGQAGFGTSSLIPTSFNGPGGNNGLSPAVPLLGSNTKKLKKDDLVFLDIACGYNGYHTDATMLYTNLEKMPTKALEYHKRCLEIQNIISSKLKPGNIPSEIYKEVLSKLDEDFSENFMGYQDRKVSFLGHGIGLQIDEYPVIANRFDKPLEENMVLAIEPKVGVDGFGMVGVENSFVVTNRGGKSLTGDGFGIIDIF